MRKLVMCPKLAAALCLLALLLRGANAEVISNPGGAPIPAGTNTIGKVEITDGTNTMAVKPASTAPLATDPASVVSISPNTAPLIGITPIDRTITSATGSSQTVMAANASRHSLTIENTGNANCGVNPTGGTAVIGGAGTLTLVPFGSYTPLIPTLSAVTTICTAGQPLYANEN